MMSWAVFDSVPKLYLSLVKLRLLDLTLFWFSKDPGSSSRLERMTNTMATRIAAASGALAVILGAFGAHGLKDMLTQNGTAAIWDKAVFYHFIHTAVNDNYNSALATGVIPHGA
jgi:hypothetical protein